MFSLSLRSVAFNVSLVALSLTVLIGIPLLFNSCFKPLLNSAFSLSDFAEKNDIRLVIPFSQKGEEVFKNPAIYQINTPQSYLYSEVYEQESYLM